MSQNPSANSPQKATADTREGEHELISRAQAAVSQCNWVVGECASQWTERDARGRTDADFAALLGLTAGQVFQRRRVWETFADVHSGYKSLKWSHFYAALTWDDAPECLQWADENETSVAEMKAWRRAMRGEELSAAAETDEWGGGVAGEGDGSITFVPEEAVAVKDPNSFGESNGPGRPARAAADADDRVAAETVGGIARDSNGDAPYAPFRSGAGSPAPKESESVAVAPRPQLSPEQLISRISGALERMNESLTGDVLKAFKTLPEKKRTRFLKAVSALSSKAARLM